LDESVPSPLDNANINSPVTILLRSTQVEKTAAHLAHFVFADTKANVEKPKELKFFQRF